MKLEFKIPRAALELHRFALQSTGAEHDIMALRIEKYRGTLTAVATDNHRLCSVKWKYSKKLDPENIKLLPIHLNAGAVGAFLSELSWTKRSVQFYIVIDDNNELQLLTNKAGSVDVGQYEKNPSFPEWEDHVPKRVNGTNGISKVFGVNLKYIREFGDYLGALGLKTRYVRFQYEDPTDRGPILLTPEEVLPTEIKSIEYIVMPVRL